MAWHEKKHKTNKRIKDDIMLSQQPKRDRAKDSLSIHWMHVFLDRFTVNDSKFLSRKITAIYLFISVITVSGTPNFIKPDGIVEVF